MKFALIGQDIPSLLPALLADLFFAHKSEAEAVVPPALFGRVKAYIPGYTEAKEDWED